MQSSLLVQDRSTEAIHHAKAWGNDNFQNLASLFDFLHASLTRNWLSCDRTF